MNAGPNFGVKGMKASSVENVGHREGCSPLAWLCALPLGQGFSQDKNELLPPFSTFGCNLLRVANFRLGHCSGNGGSRCFSLSGETAERNTDPQFPRRSHVFRPPRRIPGDPGLSLPDLWVGSASNTLLPLIPPPPAPQTGLHHSHPQSALGLRGILGGMRHHPVSRSCGHRCCHSHSVEAVLSGCLVVPRSGAGARGARKEMGPRWARNEGEGGAARGRQGQANDTAAPKLSACTQL
ncbi:uncharacterized protein LOC115070250 [Nannospalax galili]|uniref:uncharacterized protein LOC115070250 n=1 Tax=Nannospalax galili TaxID=1026970 RepID=UPI00111BD2E3|nr:uncharacterized protein LOC115070250 [Nannospalax galili]